MTENKHPLPELLAPAGSQESLRAALAGGADAVYFGGSSFSNRMRAKNFTDDALRDAIKLCHDCGAKAYITVNTRIRDRELDDVLRLCGTVLGGEEKCDAIIMADLGLAREVTARFPHAVLHASTQTSLSSPADCAELAKIGFSRLVIPREMSCGEIRSLNESCASFGFETEMFIHGAHCVSCSGQCLMSFIMGGRSGNRGECAQPCRLPYKFSAGRSEKNTADSTYPLSLADMCLGGRIPDVLSTGVSSLKIEGRLKSAPYVYGVTKIYRTLLDERRCAAPEEIRALSDLFSRGFTDGYFVNKYTAMKDTAPEKADKTSKNNKNSQSGKAEARLSDTVSKAIGERIASVREKRLSGEGSTPLSASFVLRSGSPAVFTLICGSICASAEGDIPQSASGRALDGISASRNLTKLGGTGYSLSADAIKFDIEDGLWLPASSLNELRRRTVEKLNEAAEAQSANKNHPQQKKADPTPDAYKPPHPASSAEKCAMLCESPLIDSDALPALSAEFDRIYVPHESISKAASKIEADKLCAILPVLAPDDGAVEAILSSLGKIGIRRVLCHTIGQISLVRTHGFTPDISYRANITNSSAAEYYRSLGCASIMLSPEMSGGAYKAMGGGAIVYGRLPLMTLARCVISGGKCARGNIGGRICSGREAKPHECRGYLTDRLGERFPVFGQNDCTNVVYNAAVNYAGDCMEQVKGAEQYWFIFTTEDADTAKAVLDKFGRRAPLDTNVRRI